MKYLIAWLDPDNGSRFRSRIILAESDEEAMLKLLKKVQPTTPLTVDLDFSELESSLVAAAEVEVECPLLVLNLGNHDTVFSMEDY